MKRVLITFCLCTLVLTACSTQQVIKTPTIIKITEVELLDINRNDATVRIGALFHNPNAVDYTLENITFNTFIDGQPLGHSRVLRYETALGFPSHAITVLFQQTGGRRRG